MDEKQKWLAIPVKTKIDLMKRHKNGESMDMIASAMGWKTRSLTRELNRFARTYHDIITGIYQSTSIPESPSKIYNDYPVINADDAIIIGDTEIPDHSAMMFQLALLIGMKRGIKLLIHGGDVVATDQAALNAWTPTWNVPGDTTYERMINLTNDIFFDLGRWFDETHIIEGNHDDRIARATGGNVHLGMMLRNERVRYSRYSYLYMRTSERGLIKVVHPQNFSSDPVTLGQQLYDVERGPEFDPMRPFETMEKSHFILFHTHRDQQGMSKDGVYEIHSVGTGRDERRTQYKRKAVNKHRQWDSSFIAVKNGYIDHLRIIGTNWREELGDLYDISPLAQVEGHI